MRILKKIIRTGNSRNTSIGIYALGDCHLGNRGCDTEQLKKDVKEIQKAKNSWWIGMGDYIDCINYSDKRFDSETIDIRYLKELSNCVYMQCQDFIDIIKPIKHKCIGLLRGNHEDKIRSKYHYDAMNEMKEKLDVQLLGDSAFIKLVTINKGGHSSTYEIFVAHGRIAGRKGGNKINHLEDLTGFINADIYLIGHSHIKAFEKKIMLYVDRNCNLKERTKLLGVTGTYLKGYDENFSGYVERLILPPSDIGCLKIKITPYRNKINIIA